VADSIQIARDGDEIILNGVRLEPETATVIALLILFFADGDERGLLAALSAYVPDETLARMSAGMGIEPRGLH